MVGLVKFCCVETAKTLANFKGKEKLKKILSILTIVTSILAGTMVGNTLQTNTAQAAIQPSSQELAQARTEILNATNAARAKSGVAPLVLNSALNTVAQNCSTTQANNFDMAHCENYQNNYPAGATRWGENVAAGYSYEAVTPAWIASPGHYTNIMDSRFTDLGIGLAYDDYGYPYYTQNFGAYSSTVTVPGTPTQISASPSTTPGAATVTWNASTSTGNSPVTSYELQATASGETTVYDQVPATGASTQTLTFDGLKGGVTYEIRVRAVNVKGPGAYSAPATVTVTGTPTVYIGSINPTSTTAVINFTAEANGNPVQAYTINFSNKPSVTLQGTATSYTVTGLQPGTNTSGSITATNSAGASAPANFSFTTLATVPGAPRSVNAIVENKNEIKVGWRDPASDGGAPITSYDVALYLNGELQSTTNVIDEQNIHVFGGLTRGNTYQYIVTANNRVGSTPSTTGTITVPVTAPTATENVTAELVDEQEITVSWDVPEDNGGAEITEYEIDIYANGSLVTTETSTTNSVTFVSDIIKASTNYSFSVKAVNETGLKSPAAVSNTVNVPATPTAPTPVTSLSAEEVTSNSFNIVWNQPNSNGGKQLTGYTWAVTADGEVIDSGTTNPETTIVSVENLNPYTEYTYTVQAANSIGSSPAATEVQRTLANKPSAPALVSHEPTGLNSISVTVNSVNKGGDNNITYTIELWLGEEKIDSIQSTTGTVEFTDVNLNTIYTVKATAKNSGGTSNIGSGIVTSATLSTAPQNLNVESTTSGLNVTWEEPENSGTYPITQYTVTIYNTDEEKISERVITGTNLSTLFALSDNSTIRPNTNYVVTVVPYTHESNIPGESASVETTTVKTAPSAVQNITTNANQETRKVTVNWEAPASNGGEPITQYTVILTNQGTNDTYSSSVTSTSYTTPGTLNPNAQYVIKITPVNSIGLGTPTTITVTTDAFTPSAPTATFKWTADNKVTGVITPDTDTGGSPINSYQYRIYNVTKNAWATEPITTTSPNFEFTGEYGNNYRATILSTNVIGNSETYTTSTAVIPVIAPDDAELQIGTVTADTATVTWEKPEFNGGAEITGYTLNLTNTETGVTTQHTATATATSYLFTNLESYTDYTVTITTSNGVLQSTSGSVEFKTSLPKSAPVTNLNVALTGPTANSGLITWTAPNDVPEEAETLLAYDITVTDVTSNSAETYTNIRTNSYPLSLLNRGHEYTVSVTAHYSTEQTRSDAVTTEPVTIAIIAPEPVTDVNVAFNTPLTPKFTWELGNNNGAEATYILTLKTGAATVTTYEGSDTSYTAPKLQPDTEYTFTIEAVNVAGISEAYENSFTTGRVAPSPVTNVQLTNVTGETSATVTFTESAEPGGGTTAYQYTLYTEAGAKVIEQTTNLFTNLTRGATYYVEVTASNSAGSSNPTKSNTVFVEPEAPAPATNVKTTPANNGTTNVTVTWDAPEYNGGAEIVKYTVNVWKNDVYVTNYVLENDQLDTEYVLTGLNPNTNYSVNVVTDNGYGSTSTAATNFTTVIVKPSAATNPELTVNQSTATLTGSFSPSENNGGENVTYTATVYTTDKTVLWTGAVTPETGFTVQGSRGQSYYAEIVAENSAGKSPVTKTSTVAVNAVEPNAPTNAKATVAENNTVILTWEAPTYNGGSEITGYVYEIVQGTKVIKTGTVTNPTVTVTALAPNQNYGVSIVAVNKIGESNALTVDPLFTTNIIPATISVTTDNITSNSFDYAVNIVDNGGEENSNFTYEIVVTENGKTVDTSTTATGSFNGLIHATNYTITVTATNTAGSTSETATVKTKAVAPNSPTNVKAEIVGQQSTKVTWDVPENGGAEITGYSVYYTNETNTISGNVKTGKVNSIVIDNLTRGEKFTFTVTAINSIGESEVSVTSNPTSTAPATEPAYYDTKELAELINTGSLTKFIATVKGNIITITLNGEPGTWFFGVAHSEPQTLGWDNAVNNEINFALGTLPAGSHNLAVYNEEGTLIGYAPFTLAADIDPVTPTDPETNTGSGDESGNGNQTTETTTQELSRTGSNFDWLLWSSIAAFLMSAGALLLVSRRKQTI